MEAPLRSTRGGVAPQSTVCSPSQGLRPLQPNLLRESWQNTPSIETPAPQSMHTRNRPANPMEPRFSIFILPRPLQSGLWVVLNSHHPHGNSSRWPFSQAVTKRVGMAWTRLSPDEHRSHHLDGSPGSLTHFRASFISLQEGHWSQVGNRAPTNHDFFGSSSLSRSSTGGNQKPLTPKPMLQPWFGNRLAVRWERRVRGPIPMFQSSRNHGNGTAAACPGAKIDYGAGTVFKYLCPSDFPQEIFGHRASPCPVLPIPRVGNRPRVRHCASSWVFPRLRSWNIRILFSPPLSQLK